MFERHHFAQDLASGLWTMTELCARYRISRNTGYKWRERFLASGVAGLSEHSRAPLSSPGETSGGTVALILAEHARYGWGARKILERLQTKDPTAEWPARSTIFDILARNGCVRRRRSRTQWKHSGSAPLQTSAPNQVWTIDFNGQFRTRDGISCYPLTIVDHFSRYVLCCQRFPDVKADGVHRQLRQLFRRHGLPDAIRTDNGTPFASNGIHGLGGHLKSGAVSIGHRNASSVGHVSGTVLEVAVDETRAVTLGAVPRNRPGVGPARRLSAGERGMLLQRLRSADTHAEAAAHVGCSAELV